MRRRITPLRVVALALLALAVVGPAQAASSTSSSTAPAKSGHGGHHNKKNKNRKNPPIVLVPGLLGSFVTVTITEAGCDAMLTCSLVRLSQPEFVRQLIEGPVVANDFFTGTTPGSPTELAERAALLVALLTQSYDAPANTIDYPAGVTVGNNGTAAMAYCDGIADAYLYGLVDKYFVKQAGYTIGTNFACRPYDWQLDMLGLEQTGVFDALEQQVRELYESPANDPPRPSVPRRKVVLVGHSMGTLVSTSALLARPGLREMVDNAVLLSPVSAGAALTWEVTLYGGDVDLYLGALGVHDKPTPEQIAAIRFVLWTMGQISATNPVLAPYSLPPYRFRRLPAPEFPNGFSPATEVGTARATQGSGEPDAEVSITVAGQLGALEGPLFRDEQGASPFEYIQAIWARSHSYDQNVVSWSTAGSAPKGVRLLCAYGVAVPTILRSAVRAPFPYPAFDNIVESYDAFTQDVSIDQDRQIFSVKGDGIVNKQGSNGCNRMADHTGGQVFTSASPDCSHIAILGDGPGANRLLNRVMTSAGVNVYG